LPYLADELGSDHTAPSGLASSRCERQVVAYSVEKLNCGGEIECCGKSRPLCTTNQQRWPNRDAASYVRFGS